MVVAENDGLDQTTALGKMTVESPSVELPAVWPLVGLARKPAILGKQNRTSILP